MDIGMAIWQYGDFFFFPQWPLEEVQQKNPIGPFFPQTTIQK